MKMQGATDRKCSKATGTKKGGNRGGAGSTWCDAGGRGGRVSLA